MDVFVERCAGIDIGKHEVVACVRTPDPSGRGRRKETRTFTSFTGALEEMADWFTDRGVTEIAMEATGSYWMRMVTSLSQLGYCVSVINPQQAHHFAKAYLKHSKTDQIDALTLLKLAITFQPAVWQQPPALYTELAQRLNQREDLLKVRQQLSNQRHALLQQPLVIEAVRLRLELLLETLDAQLATIERELRAVLTHDAAWAEAARRLQTIPGIGLLTAVTLIVTTLAFSSCSSVEGATAYAGLAPHRRDSGSSIRGHTRVARHGNKQLRTALYQATLSAARFNPVIKPFYERLRAAGKPPKVARCAAARKLLHLAYAVVTNQCDFDPARAPTPAAEIAPAHS